MIHTSTHFIIRGLGLSHNINLNAREGGNKMNPRVIFLKDNKFQRFRKKLKRLFFVPFPTILVPLMGLVPVVEKYWSKALSFNGVPIRA